MVRNQSDFGAKLPMDQAFALPMSFRLAIAVDERVRTVRVVWRGLDEIDVRFEDDAT